MSNSLAEAVGNTLAVGFTGTSLPSALARACKSHEVAGVILFRRNIESIEQTRALIQEAERAFEESAGLIAVDQEGGRVARFSSPVVKLPPMRKLSELDDVALTRKAAAVLGEQLRWLGITMNFAPVLDVDSNPKNPIIGDRAFGTKPEQVIRHARAFADGLASQNVLAVGKHFPGHGDTETDSHLTLPIVLRERKQLEACEFAPFVALASSLPALMSAHVLFPALDAKRPATLSHAVMHELLRERMKFNGVAISDDLEMKAVRDQWGIVGAGVEAIAAGCDLLLVCSELEASFELHAAIYKEAERSSTFRARVQEAAHRVSKLRKSIAPLPKPSSTMPVADARNLEGELEKKGLFNA